MNNGFGFSFNNDDDDENNRNNNPFGFNFGGAGGGGLGDMLNQFGAMLSGLRAQAQLIMRWRSALHASN